MNLAGWFQKEALIVKLNKFFKQKKYDEILNLTSSGQSFPERHTFRIWALMETKQMEKAKEAVDQALSDHPDHEVFLTLTGEIHYRLNQFADAQRYLLKALELSPGNLQVEYLLGLNHVAQGQLEEAAEYFDSILRYDPTLLQTRLLTMTEHYIFKNRQ